MNTQTVIAWVNQYSDVTPKDMEAMTPGLAGRLTYTSDSEASEEFFSANGYTRVGTAEITLHLIGADQMVLNKIDSLKAEAAKTRADAAVRCNEIENQIQNLLAITYAPGAA